MSLCRHGYTAGFDCPICPCNCGSGKPADECRCDPVVVRADLDCAIPGMSATVEITKSGRETIRKALEPMTAWPFPKDDTQ